MDDLTAATSQLVHALEASPLVYALGGALANAVWGVPRATLDIDLNIWCETSLLPETLARLLSIGVEGDLETAVARAAADGVAYLRWQGIRLDVFVPSIPFYDEALRTRVRIDVPDLGPTWVLSAEALCVFKLLFFRPKDLIDIEKIARVRGPALDSQYVLDEVRAMVGDDDPRVARWTDILSRVRAVP